MAISTLLTHCGASPVSYEQLAKIKAPEPTDTWFPLAHAHVLGTEDGSPVASIPDATS